MSIEERMEREAASQSDTHPLLWRKLHQPRSIFTPGHRILMNIIPMCINICVPWGMFIFCAGLTSFSFHYTSPVLTWVLMGVCILFAIGSLAYAIYARRFDPEPTWHTFFALMICLAVIFGVAFGCTNFKENTQKYFAVQDLKTAREIDASVESGQNVMDAGIIYFSEANGIDSMKSWHFKHRETYCVVPIIGNFSTPISQSYDFWAVGKNCCSLSASDFRCGAATLPQARSAIRVVDDEDLLYYGLAVEQASTLYNILAAHPIFVYWEENPEKLVNSWDNEGFSAFVKATAFFLVLDVFCVAIAACCFAWIGRGESVYDIDFYSDPDWKQGGYMQAPVNVNTQMFAP